MPTPRGAPSDARDRTGAAAIALLHLAVAAAYKWGAGVDIAADPKRGVWDWYWQHLPLDLLRTDLLRSLWYLHAQPPLHNLWGGVLAKLFHPHHLQAMQVANLLLGAALCGMVYLLLVRLTARRTLAAVAAAALALHPSLFLYEAYPLYSLPSAFLVVLQLHLLGRWRATGSERSLHGFVAALNLLVLERSLFHVLLLPLAVALAALLAAPGRRGRVTLVAAALCLPALGVCLKNQVVFGFFGTTSWTGLNLWNAASQGHSREELRKLAAQGVVDPRVLGARAFSRPGNYTARGFRAESSVPALSRNDRHNVNVPEISRVHLASALRLIAHDPARYAATVGRAYAIYCAPTSRFHHLEVNRRKLRLHEEIYSDGLLAARFLDAPGRGLGSLVFFLLPAAVLLHLGRTLRPRPGGASLADRLRADAPLHWACLLVVYATLVGCAFEFGENNRFRFLTEPAFWAFAVVVAERALNRGTEAARDDARTAGGLA